MRRHATTVGWLLLALALPPALPARAARPDRPLQVKVVDARRIVVHGGGFPDRRLEVTADLDAPHASVACSAQWQVAVQAHGGRFKATITAEPQSDCSFSCDRDRTPYMVAVYLQPGENAIASGRFSCAARRSAHEGAVQQHLRPAREQ